MKTEYTVSTAAGPRKVTVRCNGKEEGPYTVTVGDESLVLDLRSMADGEYHLLLGDRSHDVLVYGVVPHIVVVLDGEAIPVELMDERKAARLAAAGFGPSRGADGTVAICAPMPGKVVKCLVQEGDEVQVGAGIIVVEAMKMENELRSPVDGKVQTIRVSEGQNVEAGEDLVLIE